MIDSFFINFIPSTIGCNKPNQPILYGPLLLWKAPITNRSIKAKSPTVPSKYNVINFILIIAKQLAVTINKNNTTAVSAASKPHSRLVKSKTLQSK